jgi:hypothetical protein
MVDAEIIREWISNADEDFKFAHQKIPRWKKSDKIVNI